MRLPRRSLVRAAAVVGVAGAVAVGGAAVSQAVVGPPPTPPTSSSTEPSDSDAAKAERKADRDAAKAERKAAKAERKAQRQTDGGPPAAQGHGTRAADPVEFVCDPSQNHGQNVSAYARSLPKGPGRGRQVSAAARSDCGKPPR